MLLMMEPTGSIMAPKAPASGTPPPGSQRIILDGDFLPATFRTQSLQLAKDAVRYVCYHDAMIEPPTTRASRIMRGLVDDTLKERLDLMNEMARRLEIKDREQLRLLDNIATEMFDDQIVNWGRIVTFHAFCGYLARHCQEHNTVPDCADDVARILADIVVNRLGLWIVAHGGWATFEKQFPNSWMFESSGIWKGLFILGLFVGGLFLFYSAVRYMNAKGF